MEIDWRECIFNLIGEMDWNGWRLIGENVYLI